MQTDKSFLEKISPRFAESTLDIAEIMKHVNDPMYLSALVFKLIEEREKTNRLLSELSEKYDKIMLELKQGSASRQQVITPQALEERKLALMGEQDESILKYINEHKLATARDIKTIMNYRGLNAASQRLNKLYREGHLNKIQQGKKVVYVVRLQQAAQGGLTA